MTDSRAAARARALVELGRFAEARSLLVTALATDPEDADLLGLLARTHVGLQEYGPALDVIGAMVRVEPDSEWGHRLAAISLGHLGRHQEALAAAATAVRCGPHHWQAHLQFALAATSVPGQLQPARQAAMRAVELAPGQADAHFAVGVVAQGQREDETARRAYEQALAIDPEHANARNNLTLLDGSLRLSRAARGYAATLRTDPGHSIARENLDGVASRMVVAVFAIQVLGFVINLLVLQAQPGEIGDSRPTPFTWLVGLAALACGAALVVRLLSSLPIGVRRHLRSRVRRPRVAGWLVILSGITVAGPLSTAFWPGSAAWGVLLLRPIGLSAVVTVVMLVVQSNRRP